ncbi:PREDICTED: crossover junction endonuclease EME1B-like isoform X2 [Camelina sativa]|uniref:Crossover junction endonuclease EME1B-like isoform X2 n=1 Tax=Camelina sativa TaxID=90675 RepID=A0ABM0WK24_CAMSA|nr:PREDICTED: crossover junction endonuclease EME1B-like isoform X2 [Camelina sativa]
MKDHILISDGEDPVTPLPSLSKRARKDPISAILISDSDPTPQKQPPESSSTPIFVPETPLSDDFSVVKCSFGSGAFASNREDKFSGKRIISLDSEFEDSPRPETSKKYESVLADFREPRCELESGETSDAYYKNTRIPETNLDDDTNWMHEVSFRSSQTNDTIEVDSDQEKEGISVEKMGRKKKIRTTGEALPKKQLSKEDKTCAMEEKKLRKEQEKLQKAALKAEEADRKKLEKEKKKWEKGKLALKSIVAEIDTKVVEGSIGGLLLSWFSEKGITIHVGPNPIERSIVWTMTVPEDIAPLFPQGPKIPYVLLVYEAEEFCNLVANEKILENISKVQDRYPSYTVCCLTNKLMSYVKKREKEEYKNPGSWRRPPIDEVLAKLTTHYVRVHSRHCVDEAEVAEHVVGLTSSLASCLFRKKLTMLSVSANGAIVSKDSIDKQLIKKSPWLKALVAIPKVQPRYAVAVWKKYPSMKSLLKAYMDPNKSVHEKEFLLQDLKVEGLVGGDRRLGEICSKRIYRVLMSHNGAIKTDDVENGAALFTDSPGVVN